MYLGLYVRNYPLKRVVCVWQVMSEIDTKEFAIVVTSHEHVLKQKQ